MLERGTDRSKYREARDTGKTARKRRTLEKVQTKQIRETAGINAQKRETAGKRTEGSNSWEERLTEGTAGKRGTGKKNYK